MQKKANPAALLPILEFLLLYLGLGLIFEYVLRDPDGLLFHPYCSHLSCRAAGGVLPEPRAEL